MLHILELQYAVYIKEQAEEKSLKAFLSCDILPAAASSYSKHGTKSDVMFNNFTVS